ncbi:TetR/AcrR family transcriptional regulator [Actinomadura geliboluensis]|uniref:TetR/AcrR family transcriptional regulator n=1 Tax=Actinomadura geliboluensis TaxID=882440 RepID=UPI003696369C
MSPREYRSDKRRAAAEETRRRILDAARALLAGDATPRLSVDAVAKAADVSRQSVYNAFGSKSGLLEALFDTLADRAGMGLADAFTAPDAAAALAEFAGTFCRFWASDRTVLRRLRGLALLDSDLEHLLRRRDEMRRTALTELLRRFPAPPDEATIDVIWQLTSFETYDALATRDQTRTPEDLARIIGAAATAVHRP